MNNHSNHLNHSHISDSGNLSKNNFSYNNIDSTAPINHAGSSTTAMRNNARQIVSTGQSYQQQQKEGSSSISFRGPLLPPFGSTALQQSRQRLLSFQNANHHVSNIGTSQDFTTYQSPINRFPPNGLYGFTGCKSIVKHPSQSQQQIIQQQQKLSQNKNSSSVLFELPSDRKNLTHQINDHDILIGYDKKKDHTLFKRIMGRFREEYENLSSELKRGDPNGRNNPEDQYAAEVLKSFQTRRDLVGRFLKFVSYYDQRGGVRVPLFKELTQIEALGFIKTELFGERNITDTDKIGKQNSLNVMGNESNMINTISNQQLNNNSNIQQKEQHRPKSPHSIPSISLFEKSQSNSSDSKTATISTNNKRTSSFISSSSSPPPTTTTTTESSGTPQTESKEKEEQNSHNKKQKVTTSILSPNNNDNEAKNNQDKIEKSPSPAPVEYKFFDNDENSLDKAYILAKRQVWNRFKAALKVGVDPHTFAKRFIDHINKMSSSSSSGEDSKNIEDIQQEQHTASSYIKMIEETKKEFIAKYNPILVSSSPPPPSTSCTDFNPNDKIIDSEDENKGDVENNVHTDNNDFDDGSVSSKADNSGSSSNSSSSNKDIIGIMDDNTNNSSCSSLSNHDNSMEQNSSIELQQHKENNNRDENYSLLCHESSLNQSPPPLENTSNSTAVKNEGNNVNTLPNDTILNNDEKDDSSSNTNNTASKTTISSDVSLQDTNPPQGENSAGISEKKIISPTTESDTVMTPQQIIVKEPESQLHLSNDSQQGSIEMKTVNDPEVADVSDSSPTTIEKKKENLMTITKASTVQIEELLIKKKGDEEKIPVSSSSSPSLLSSTTTSEHTSSMKEMNESKEVVTTSQKETATDDVTIVDEGIDVIDLTTTNDCIDIEKQMKDADGSTSPNPRSSSLNDEQDNDVTSTKNVVTVIGSQDEIIENKNNEEAATTIQKKQDSEQLPSLTGNGEKIIQQDQITTAATPTTDTTSTANTTTIVNNESSSKTEILSEKASTSVVDKVETDMDDQEHENEKESIDDKDTIVEETKEQTDHHQQQQDQQKKQEHDLAKVQEKEEEKKTQNNNDSNQQTQNHEQQKDSTSTTNTMTATTTTPTKAKPTPTSPSTKTTDDLEVELVFSCDYWTIERELEYLRTFPTITQ